MRNQTKKVKISINDKKIKRDEKKGKINEKAIRRDEREHWK